MATLDPKYLSLTEMADDIFVRASSMLYSLRDEGRLDLGAPLTDVLKALGELDAQALAEIDRSHDVVKVKRG